MIFGQCWTFFYFRLSKEDILKMTQSIRNKNIEILKNRVVNVFGRKIEKINHCQDLEKQLNNKISYKTLARFFEITESDSKISLHNLDELCKYCGHKDFNYFESFLSIEFLKDSYADENSRENSLWEKANNLCQVLLTSSEALFRTHHNLMEVPRARRYFMEEHPLRDLIGTMYSQYFMEYLKYAITSDEHIFGYSFLYIGAFMTENTEMMELYSERLKKLNFQDHTYLLPVAHRYGVLLQQADFTKKGFSKIYKEMLLQRERYIEASENCVCSFEFTVLEHLIFTDRNKEMMKLVELQTHQKKENSYFVPEERINTHQKSWVLLCAWACWRNGKIKDAITIFNKVQLSDFCVGWQKFYGALYYILKLHLFDLEKKETLEKLESIILETNFTYLRRYITTGE